MHEIFPSLTQLDGGDAHLGVFEDVGLEELLEDFLTHEALHVVKQLVALLVRDRAEHVIRAVSLKDRVDARVGAIKTKSLHVLPKSRVSEKSLNLCEILTMKDT